jgi:MoaA/NifB/PqqE/SkfB family radical SAM enzyme
MSTGLKSGSAFSDLAMDTLAVGTSMALRVPPLRRFLLDRVQEHLSEAYSARAKAPEVKAHERWLGRHLRPFLDRLVSERPAAARAIVRFLLTWAQDMMRRKEGMARGRVMPTTVVIEPTARCNFNCPGCYAKSTREGADLPYEQIETIVEEVIDMGVSLITISGGEPFLREKDDRVLTRLAERFDRRGFLVYTNGTLIDEEIAERLAEVGNVFPAISVEGFEHQTDARRGKGVYAQSRRVRRMLARRGVLCGFSATVTRENCDAICTDGFLDLRIEEGDMFGWFFLIQPIGRGPRPDLMVTAPQRAELRETINRWRLEDRPIFLGDFWNDGHLVDGCIAGGKGYFHIYANGDISPCVFSPVACGNIFDIVQDRTDYVSLEDFVQNNPTFRRFREEQSKITDLARPCLLIDHPQAIRRVVQEEDCRAAKNMCPGYLDGAIAESVDERAERWRQLVPELPPVGAESERNTGDRLSVGKNV